MNKLTEADADDEVCIVCGKWYIDGEWIAKCYCGGILEKEKQINNLDTDYMKEALANKLHYEEWAKQGRLPATKPGGALKIGFTHEEAIIEIEKLWNELLELKKKSK